MTTSLAFLYHDLLRGISGSRAQWPRVLIYGGRGLGKTTLLERILEKVEGGLNVLNQAKKPKPKSVFLVEGRGPGAKERILWWQENKPGNLYIDNFDFVFDAEIEDLFKSEQETAGWIIATSRLPPGEMEKIAYTGLSSRSPLAWSDSPSIKTFHPLRLDPWASGWEKRLQAAIEDSFTWIEDRLTNIDDQEENIFSDRLHKIWMKVIQQVTGGHPVLVGGAVEGFAQLVSASGLTDKPILDDLKALASTHRPDSAALRLLTAQAATESELAQLEIGIRAYVEDYLAETRLPEILRSVHFIRSRYPQAAEHLITLAQDAGYGAILDYNLRQVLYLSGLAYSDGVAGQLAIPGSFIASALRAVFEPSAPEPIEEGCDRNQVFDLRLNPKEGFEDEQGSLLVAGAGKSTEIDLGGIQWKILARLWKEKGLPVTVEALKDELQASSKESVRTAIQRLKDTVREQGFESPLDNLRGKGYYVKKNVRRRA